MINTKLNKGDVFDVWVFEFAKRVQAKALEDSQNKSINAKLIKGGELVFCCYDDEKGWETWLA